MPAHLTAATAAAAVRAGEPASLSSRRVPGLQLRVRSASAASFRWVGRVKGGGPPVSITIGRYGIIAVPDAEVRARELAALASRGIDPRAEEAREAEAQRDADRQTLAPVVTFRAVANDYLAEFTAGRALTSKTNGAPDPESVDRERQCLDRACEILGDVPAAKLAVEHALKLRSAFGTLSDSSRRKIYGAARRAAVVAVARGLVQVNPFRELPAPRDSAPRNRGLTLDNIVAIWAAAEGLPDPLPDFVRLAITTPIRIGNWADARWCDLDGDVLFLPDTKAQKPWKTVLPTLALELLDARRARIGAIDPAARVLAATGRKWASTMRNVGGSALNALEKQKATLDKASGVEAWRYHDFRSSVLKAIGDRHPDYNVSAADAWLQHGLRGSFRHYGAGTFGLPGQRIIAGQWDGILRAALKLPAVVELRRA